MNILIVFATTEGQTEKIAGFAATRLSDAGHRVKTAEASQAPDPDGVDACILAGSVHAGAYQPALVDYARRNQQTLDTRRTLFVSVSLSAAGGDAEDWDGLRACVDRFVTETGWQPGRIEHVAGAFRFARYDFFRYWAMRWIASQKDRQAKRGQDMEYTDWAALQAALDEWAGAA